MSRVRLFAFSALAVVLITSLLALSVAGMGSAFNISFTPSYGPPGTSVSFTSPGSPLNTQQTPLIFAGTIIVNPQGIALFTVQNVPDGYYTLYWYMPDGSTGIGRFYVGRQPPSNPSVGGVVEPANKLVVLAPYLITIVSVVAVTLFVARRKGT